MTEAAFGLLNASLSRAADKALAAALHRSPDLTSDIVSWHAHIPFVHSLIALHKPNLTVELGVHKGDSFLAMAQALKTHHPEGRLLGIDCWEGDEHAGQYEGDAILATLSPKVAAFAPQAQLKRSLFDTALDDIEDQSIDLLHIDGFHSYEAVKHDFETWRPKLSSRAIVLFHDTMVFYEDFGVWKFWIEIETLAPSCNFPFGYGLGVLALGPNVEPEVLALLQSIAQNHANTAMIFAALGTERLTSSLLEQANSQITHLRAQNAQLVTTGRTDQAALAQLHRTVAALEAQTQAQAHLIDAHKGAHAALIEAQKDSFAQIEQLTQQLDLVNAQAILAQEQHFIALTNARLSRRALRGVKTILKPIYRAAPLPRSVKLKLRAKIRAWIMPRPSATPASATTASASHEARQPARP